MEEHVFKQHWSRLEAWVNSMRPHWARCSGDVNNDQEFWRECLHQVKGDVWLSWCELYNTLEDTYPKAWITHSHILEDTQEMARRLDRGKPMTIPFNKTGYNKAPFRAAMAIKDIMATITDRPFDLHTKVKTKPTRAEVIAQIDALRERVQELFDDE